MKNSFWSSSEAQPDSYSAFRGEFEILDGGEVELRATGATWYQAWLDGRPLLEGPLRHPLERPEYQSLTLCMEPGRHVLAFEVHHAGVETRILKDTPAFLWCGVFRGQAPVPIRWRCLPLDSQSPEVHRINPQLAWVEWRDTRKDPPGWQLPAFDDSAWGEPVSPASPLPEPAACDLAPVGTFPHALRPIAEGPLATAFGYATDDPSYVFFSRDRTCGDLPAKGIWRRYDLGRVRLGRPAFEMDLPPGAIVEFALAESLTHGCVSPHITLSAGRSCNLDRFVARGGVQEFCPLTPKGGRFLEVHVVNAREQVRFLGENFLERCYHAPTGAAFACGDPLLEKIWGIGVETYRACAEDAVTDNPTRERGQWLGDAAAVGLQTSGVSYHDLRLCRRSFEHAALCAREDGLVAGMSPGGCAYLPTYAFQWAVGAMDYYRLTGDHEMLLQLWPAARRNMAAIRAFWHDDGLHNVAGWNFVDWGYQAEDGPVDTACNLYYLWCLRAMAAWAAAIDKPPGMLARQERRLDSLLRARIAAKLAAGGWEAVGYNCAALALRLGLVADEQGCLDFLERHLLSCFPNDPDAPRNDDPNGFNARLITPYFAHFVLPLFIGRGRMDFALGQIRACWGWMLDQGATTWMEVFDTRWSHCHQWSCCPTWILSRYLLGLHPRSDIAAGTFDFRLAPGSLPFASGRIPHPSGGWIDVSWQRKAGDITYRIQTPAPLVLRMPGGGIKEVASRGQFKIPAGPHGHRLHPNSCDPPEHAADLVAS